MIQIKHKSRKNALHKITDITKRGNRSTSPSRDYTEKRKKNCLVDDITHLIIIGNNDRQKCNKSIRFGHKLRSPITEQIIAKQNEVNEGLPRNCSFVRSAQPFPVRLARNPLRAVITPGSRRKVIKMFAVD